MRVVFVILGLSIGFILNGCNTPVPELAYNGTIPSKYGYSEDLVSDYSDRLAERLGYGSARLVGIENHRIPPNCFFFIGEGNGITVGVTGFGFDHSITVRIQGSYKSNQAVDAGRIARELFAEMFSPATMERFIRKQGFPGV